MIFVTGHRPNKILGYSLPAHQKLTRFCMSILDNNTQPKTIISGMAQGWDQAMANACMVLKIPYIAAVPCPDQEKKWPSESQLLYRFILNWAKEIVYVSPEFTPYCMQKRNEYMIDKGLFGMALWNGDKSGGTYNALKYAEKKNKAVTNYWEKWLEFEK